MELQKVSTNNSHDPPHDLQCVDSLFLPMPLAVVWVNILTFCPSSSSPSLSSSSSTHHQLFVSLRYRKCRGDGFFAVMRSCLYYILVGLLLYITKNPLKLISIILELFFLLFMTKQLSKGKNCIVYLAAAAPSVL